MDPSLQWTGLNIHALTTSDLNNAEEVNWTPQMGFDHFPEKMIGSNHIAEKMSPEIVDKMVNTHLNNSSSFDTHFKNCQFWDVNHMKTDKLREFQHNPMNLFDSAEQVLLNHHTSKLFTNWNKRTEVIESLNILPPALQHVRSLVSANVATFTPVYANTKYLTNLHNMFGGSSILGWWGTYGDSDKTFNNLYVPALNWRYPLLDLELTRMGYNQYSERNITKQELFCQQEDPFHNGNDYDQISSNLLYCGSMYPAFKWDQQVYAFNLYNNKHHLHSKSSGSHTGYCLFCDGSLSTKNWCQNRDYYTRPHVNCCLPKCNFSDGNISHNRLYTCNCHEESRDLKPIKNLFHVPPHIDEHYNLHSSIDTLLLAYFSDYVSSMRSLHLGNTPADEICEDFILSHRIKTERFRDTFSIYFEILTNPNIYSKFNLSYGILDPHRNVLVHRGKITFRFVKDEIIYKYKEFCYSAPLEFLTRPENKVSLEPFEIGVGGCFPKVPVPDYAGNKAIIIEADVVLKANKFPLISQKDDTQEWGDSISPYNTYFNKYVPLNISRQVELSISDSIRFDN